MREPSDTLLRQRWTYNLIWAVLFGISMGYFEAAVVVYLRQIVGSGNTIFPLDLAAGLPVAVEVGRETFSMVMLAAVAALLARDLATGMAWFCVIFGVWDIFYYVFLKLLLDWPASLWTMDILFLIPVPWVSPVLAPVIASVTMIGLGIAVIRKYESGKRLRHPLMLLGGEILGSLVMVTAFCWQWKSIANGAVPTTFPWLIFAAGEAILLSAFRRCA